MLYLQEYGNYFTKHKYFISGVNQIDKKRYGHPTIKNLNFIENHIVNNRMINNNEVVSYLTIYVCVFAQEEKDLVTKSKEVEREVQKLQFKIRHITKFLLKEGIKSVAPMFSIQPQLTEYFKRNILTSSFIGTFYYERLLASQDKEAVEKEIGLPEKVEPKNIIKDPYVLEFLGLEGKKVFMKKI